MKVPKKSKNQTNIPILLPKKYQKIYSTEYKHVEHLSNETKTKLVKKKIKKIKQLRDFVSNLKSLTFQSNVDRSRRKFMNC